MNKIGKLYFSVVLMWRYVYRRIRWIYYKMILGSLGRKSDIGPKVFVEFPYNVFIGSGTVINEYAIIRGSPDAPVKIGDRVHISYRAVILTVSPIQEGGYYCQERSVSAKPVIIEDDTWIAVNAVILPGVTVGARAVVAARTVVVEDVPADMVVAGMPAKPIYKLKPKM